jgi:hypothetical protein
MKFKKISYLLKPIKKIDQILLRRLFKSIIFLIIFPNNSLKFLVKNNFKSKKVNIKPKISRLLIKIHRYSKLPILKQIPKNI